MWSSDLVGQSLAGVEVRQRNGQCDYGPRYDAGGLVERCGSIWRRRKQEIRGHV